VEWTRLINEIDRVTNDELLVYLKDLLAQGYKLTQIEDEKNFNLLHHAVLKGHHGKVCFLIETVKKLD